MPRGDARPLGVSTSLDTHTHTHTHTHTDYVVLKIHLLIMFGRSNDLHALRQ